MSVSPTLSLRNVKMRMAAGAGGGLGGGGVPGVGGLGSALASKQIMIKGPSNMGSGSVPYSQLSRFGKAKRVGSRIGIGLVIAVVVVLMVAGIVLAAVFIPRTGPLSPSINLKKPTKPPPKKK